MAGMNKCHIEGKTVKRALFFVRIMPTENRTPDVVNLLSDGKTIKVRTMQDFLPMGPSSSGAKNFRSYTTDGILNNADQEEVYKTVMSGILEGLMQGYSAVIMSYGQAASGKTFTTSGVWNNFKYRGLAPRILKEMISEKQRLSAEEEVRIWVSAIEVNGESIVDLLDLSMSPRRPTTNQLSRKPLTPRSPATTIPSLRPSTTSGRPTLSLPVLLIPDKSGLTHPKGIIRVEVKSEEEVFKLLMGSEQMRATSSFRVPGQVPSHTGHALTTVYVECRSTQDSTPVIRHAKLHLLDAAGIPNKIPVEGRNDADIAAANKTLAFIENFIRLRSEGKKFIATRHCPLLHIMADTLKPYCNLRMVAHIRQERCGLEGALWAVRFAESVRIIHGVPTQTLSSDSSLLSAKLKRQISDLRDELLAYDVLHGRSSAVQRSGPQSQEEAAVFRRQAVAYLQGQIPFVPLESLDQVQAMFNIFKDLYNEVKPDPEAKPSEEETRAKEKPSKTKGKRIEKEEKEKEKEREKEKEKEKEKDKVSKDKDDSVKDIPGKEQTGDLDKKGFGVGPAAKKVNKMSGDPGISKTLRSKRLSSFGKQREVISPDSRSSVSSAETTPRSQVSTEEEKRLSTISTDSTAPMEVAPPKSEDVPHVWKETISLIPHDTPSTECGSRTREQAFRDYVCKGGQGEARYKMLAECFKNVRDAFKEFAKATRSANKLLTELKLMEVNLRIVLQEKDMAMHDIMTTLDDPPEDVSQQKTENQLMKKLRDLKPKTDAACELQLHHESELRNLQDQYQQIRDELENCFNKYYIKNFGPLPLNPEKPELSGSARLRELLKTASQYNTTEEERTYTKVQKILGITPS